MLNDNESHGELQGRWVRSVHREAKKGLPEMVMNKPCHVVSWEQVVPDRRTSAKVLKFKAWEEQHGGEHD